MKKVVWGMFILAGLVTACARVPLTGRKQLLLVPNDQILALSSQQYQQFLDTSRVVNSGDAEMVRRVGERIHQAVDKYLAANNLSKRVEGFKWEYNLVQSPQVNAWCMPGGKIVVYSGILPYTQNEAGLATVLGHEVSHAIAEHSNERMSESLIANGLMTVGQAYLGSQAQNSSTTRALLMQAVGAGLPAAYQVGRALPHSRAQESEADHLGLIFMSLAGYNPQEAVTFWSRMAKASAGRSTPEFLSDHPADNRRIADLQKWMPEAMKYRSSGVASR